MFIPAILVSTDPDATISQSSSTVKVINLKNLYEFIKGHKARSVLDSRVRERLVYEILKGVNTVEKETNVRKWLLKPREQMNLIRLTVADLGFPDGATTEQILARAVALGLDLCPPEVGPYYRLQYTDQPMNEWVRIGMKPIPDRGDSGRVFSVERSWLDDVWANPGDHWRAVNLFLFRLRK